jgi:hypothetical protein
VALKATAKKNENKKSNKRSEDGEKSKSDHAASSNISAFSNLPIEPPGGVSSIGLVRHLSRRLRTVQRPIHREKAKSRGMKKQVDDFVLG